MVLPSMRHQKQGSMHFLVFSIATAIFLIIIGECACQDCSVRPQPQVIINGETTVIDEDKFPKHYGSFPPESCGENENLPYYILHEKPVLYIPNFLNESIAEELKSFCINGNRFVRSSIRGHGDGSTVQKHELRTSESCALVPAVTYMSNHRFQALINQNPMDPQVERIAREVDVSWDIASRASKLLNVNAGTVEALQLVRYTTPDAEYKLHHDHGGYYGKSTEHRPWTMLIFLNDVADGGHTAFPKLGLEIVPRGGDALVWANTQQSEVDSDMVHMGKPPSQHGIEKYAVNVWFGEDLFDERTSERKW